MTKPAAPGVLAWSGITALRMARHFLAEPATGLGPVGVAGVLCGAHAQELSAAELSIGRLLPAGPQPRLDATERLP